MWPFSPKVLVLTPPGLVMRRKRFIAFVKPLTLIVRELYLGQPMCRVIFSDGTATKWHKYDLKKSRHAVAIETCAPDQHGMPTLRHHRIGL